mmetsp:Transcript_1474/g.4726  ORF Transcript_1474/g.4726 Transcript_1474/m.4726 type:complete len:456 (+) Transcript_1474:518-1885(+)
MAHNKPKGPDIMRTLVDALQPQVPHLCAGATLQITLCVRPGRLERLGDVCRVPCGALRTVGLAAALAAARLQRRIDPLLGIDAAAGRYDGESARRLAGAQHDDGHVLDDAGDGADGGFDALGVRLHLEQRGEEGRAGGEASRQRLRLGLCRVGELCRQLLAGLDGLHLERVDRLGEVLALVGRNDGGREHPGQLGRLGLDIHAGQLLGGLDAGREGCRLRLRSLGLVARQADDAAHAAAHALLGQQHEGARLRRAPDVGAAAKLDGEVAPLGRVGRGDHLAHARAADGDDAHRVRVLLSEDGAETINRLGRVERHDLRMHCQVGLDLPVDRLLCRGELLDRQGLAVRKVEAQLVRVAQRAALVGVSAQRLAERVVEHVGRRVVASDWRAASVVDGERELVTNAHLAIRDAADVGDEGTELLDVRHGEDAARGRGDCAQVTNLAAGLGVEGGAVQH